MDTSTKTTGRVTPWNTGKLLGQKPPLKLKEIWAIRIRLQLDHRTRELALQKSSGRSTPPWAHRIGKHGRYLGIEVDDALEIAEQTEV